MLERANGGGAAAAAASPPREQGCCCCYYARRIDVRTPLGRNPGSRQRCRAPSRKCFATRLPCRPHTQSVAGREPAAALAAASVSVGAYARKNASPRSVCGEQTQGDKDVFSNLYIRGSRLVRCKSHSHARHPIRTATLSVPLVCVHTASPSHARALSAGLWNTATARPPDVTGVAAGGGCGARAQAGGIARSLRTCGGSKRG